MSDWNDALLEVCRLLEKEAAACIGDIVPGDELGRKLMNAKAGALLTAIGDVTVLKRPSEQDGWRPALQYYFRTSGCSADSPDKPNCICWHDEGTGPYAEEPLAAKSWRLKHLPAPPTGGE